MYNKCLRRMNLTAHKNVVEKKLHRNVKLCVFEYNVIINVCVKLNTFLLYLLFLLNVLNESIT